MIAKFVFVPPDGGEADFSLDFQIDTPPQPGDYITIRRPDEHGTSDFVVRRCWWQLKHPISAMTGQVDAATPDQYGEVTGLVIECEFAVGPFSSETHKRSCDSYKAKKGKLIEFDDTCC